MSTQLFFRRVDNDMQRGILENNQAGVATIWLNKIMSLSRGSAATSTNRASVAGPTPGIELGGAWWTRPFDADVTISGTITANLRCAEDTMFTNAAINVRIQRYDGQAGTLTDIVNGGRTTEMGTSEAAANYSITPTSTDMKRGDRLRIVVFADDAGTMSASGLITFWWDGPTAGATGDSYLTFTENISFTSADPVTPTDPPGTKLWLTNTTSAVATASVDREAWTSRGGGVQTDVTNTVTGPTSGLQVTDTAGGTVVDWFSRPLAAMTLGGAVLCNLRASAAVEDRAAHRMEIAVVDNDGTNAVTWAVGVADAPVISSIEAAKIFLIGGPDTAITEGQRVRIRWMIGEVSGQLTSGRSVTTYYAGTSDGASGDSYLVFSETLTESTGAPARVPRRVFPGALLAQ